MKTYPCLLLILFAFVSCSKGPEVVEGPLTRELLQRHIVDRGPTQYTGDSGGKLGMMPNKVADVYHWKCDEVFSIKRQTSSHATILVRVSGFKVRYEDRRRPLLRRKRGGRSRRRIEYGHTSRTVTLELSRNSVEDFWRVDQTSWVLKLKTGPYVEPVESEKLVPIAKPVSQSEDQKTIAKPLAESSPPEPPIEPQPEPLEEIRDVTPELNTLKTQLASVKGELTTEETHDYPDTVVLKTGREMECEILDETETSIHIKTSSGTASMSKSRIESFRYATESEKAQALEAISRNDEIRKQIDDIAQKITEIETRHKEALDNRQALRGKELLDYAEDGHGDLVSQFLDAGMEPDVRDHNRRTPLMLAAFEGHNEVVEALLNAGTDLNARDVDGWEALTYAAYGGRTETVRLLIEKGADVDANANSGQSVLTIARQKGHQEVIDLLQRKGAKP